MKHDGTTHDSWHPGELATLPAMIARVRAARDERCPRCDAPVMTRQRTTGGAVTLDAHPRPGPEIGALVLLPDRTVTAAGSGSVQVYTRHSSGDDE